MQLHPQILKLHGVRPVRQRRSAELLTRLLGVGEELLRKKNFDEISIAEIAERAEATVGAFYSRLDSKEVFFKAMHLNATLSLRTDLPVLVPIERLSQECDEVVVAHIVAAMVDRTREHRGLIRATLQQSTAKLQFFNPTAQYARTFVEHCRFIQPRLKPPQNSSLEQHFQFGFQLLGGFLINLLLFEPGPWTMDDPELVQELSHALLRYWDFTTAVPNACV